MTVSELLTKIEERVRATQEALLAGRASNWEEYKMLTARLRAFQEVFDLAREMPTKREMNSESS